MPPIDESAKSLYTRFNVSQLRELALASRLSSEAVSRLRSKEEAVSAIDSISDRNRLALLSHRIEALSPYKHCVLLESPKKFSYGQISAACKRAFGSLLSSFVPLQSDEKDLHLQLCIDDSVSERVFIKFAHMVEVWETMPSADKQQLKVIAPKRHVMVAELNAAQQLISISFPGFTQAVVGKDRVTYYMFAAQVVEILEKKLSLKLEAFKLKAVTDFMLDDKEQEVVDLRRTLRFKRGGKMDLDSESDEDAAFALAQGLANSGVKISAEAIRLAFRSSEAQAIVLLWQKREVLTRISLRNVLPEILFIWNEAEPSLSLVEEILGRLAWARAFISSDGMRDAKEYIANAPEGEILRPSWFEQHFALTQVQSLQLLLEASALNICAVRFRINSELHSVAGRNPWVANIAALPTDIKDDDGNLIPTRNPSDLEVAFEKVKRLGEVNLRELENAERVAE